MTDHASGSGSFWQEGSPDVDRTIGGTYNDLLDIRIGVRKRLQQEHTTPADATVGGLHKPGAVACVDVLESTADMSNYYDDGSYHGGGLIYCFTSGAGKFGKLFCITGDGTYGVAGDLTVLKLHPDQQWGGGDITWAGNHEFDGSVDFTGKIQIDASVDMSGFLAVSRGVYCASDMSVSGTLKVGTDFSLGGDVGIDGTVNITGAVKFTGDISTAAATTVNIGSDVSIGGKLTVKAVDYSRQTITAWGICNSAGTIIASQGVNTVTRSAAGDFSIQWTSAFTDGTTYVVSVAIDSSGAGYPYVANIYDLSGADCGIKIMNTSGWAAYDPTKFRFMAVGY